MRGRRRRELDGIAERALAVAAGVLHFDDHLAMAHLRIGEGLAERRHRAEADVEVGEHRDPLHHGALAEARADALEHLLARLALVELPRAVAPGSPIRSQSVRQKCGSSAPTVTCRPSFVS